MKQRPIPELGDLQAFVRIAEESSFSKAALALGVPKATLSRRVAELERVLGVPLFVRTTRSVQVTPAGRSFLPEARAVLATLEQATESLREVDRAPSGRLRLSADPALASTALVPLLAAFAAEHPAVVLEVELTDRRIDLAHEGFDLALRLGPPADPSRAAARLGVLRRGLHASPAYLAAHAPPRYAHDLALHPALVSDALDAGSSWTLTDGAQTLAVAVQARVRANDDRVLRDAAVAGLGIALCGVAVAEPEVAAGRLVRVLPGWGAAEVPVHAVSPDRRALTPAARACIGFLVARLEGAALA